MATVLVLNGKNGGEYHAVVKERPLTIGRDDHLLCEILDAKVSHRHAEVLFDESSGSFVVMDLNSRNGTKVNTDVCEPMLPVDDGDVIKVGHTLLVFTLRDFASYGEAKSAHKEFCQIHEKRIERNRVATKSGASEASGGLKGVFRRWKKK